MAALWGPLALRRYCLAARTLAGNDGFHDLRRTVTDLKAQHIAQALLHHAPVVTAVAEHQQALVDAVVSQFGRPPFAHGGFGAMRLAMVFEPERLQAQQTRGMDLGVKVGQRV